MVNALTVNVAGLIVEVFILIGAFNSSRPWR